MFTISAKGRGAAWLTLKEAAGEEPACRVQVRPWGTSAKAAGGEAFGRATAAGETVAVAQVAYTAGVAGWAVVAWEGVADEDGVPVPVTPEAVESLLEQHAEAYEAFDRQYVVPGLLKEAEKNGSSPLLDGTSPAGAAPKKTARRKAARGAGGTTARAARSGAKPAPTS